MHLSKLVESGRFVVTCEVGPPKGIDTSEFMNNVELIRNYVDAINVTDNQRAVMHVGSLAMCRLLKERGIEPVMQLTARDRNRIALQSDLLSAAVLGIENILLLTGDHTSMGDHVETKPVYDLDSVSLVHVARTLTRGRDMTDHALEGTPDFCLGVVATPGLEPAELHLAKLKKKIAEGAQFIQTQTVYEPEVLERFMDSIKGFDVPVLVGHVMLKSVGMARFMNSNVPGVTVPERLIKELEGLRREQVVETSLQISMELLRKMKPMCQGIHLMPMGWEKYVPTIVEAVVGERVPGAT